MINKEKIYPIGIGTWKIDYENIDNDLEALIHSYKLGQNYLSLYMLYNNGEVVRKLKKFIDIVGRENLFINVNLEPTINKREDVSKQLNEYLEILNIDYVDSLQLHKPSFSNIPLTEVYEEIKKLVELHKVRYVGISNSTLEELIEIEKVIKIDFFEGVYNLECKIYEDIKVLDYCNNHNITFICYQPLRRNRTALRNYPVLKELSEKYNKTQNQIILNWIIKEKKILPLIKCTNIDRINENNSSLDFEMSKEDYNKLNDFRSIEFDSIVVDWTDKGGVSIDQLANQFE